MFDTQPTPPPRRRARRLPAVPDREDVERAALVALLRERPTGLTWTQIAIEAGQRGSALSLWRELRPADLFHDDGAVPAPIAAAAAAILAWQAEESALLTVLDD